ncbi:helix-turn-helix transcriptional regulator [Sandaracinobacter neustonicus]|uniref:Helix-turn-helix transcriptional regulator n=1 Tax=Sandaracinobacter neustonicus TaxID=1715348 RepID=A0A501XIW6_9SPHN|nr:TetR/AcrR family transcriptional regulator [Sandaracinobacter neustonicus]TPE60490.1 helix-turn-helix transcriptional regulator [Sandaracinobacter neustonicus]
MKSPAKTRPQPRQLARARRRDRILRVAAEMLVKGGLRQTTMEEIARGLSTSKMALYRHFQTKDELIEAVLQRVVDRFTTTEQLAWPGMRAAMQRALASAREDPDAFLLLFRVAAHDPALSHYAADVRRLLGDVTRERLMAGRHPLSSDPALLEALVDGTVAFLVEATAFRIEQGDPARDSDWIRWVSDAASRMIGLPTPGD